MWVGVGFCSAGSMVALHARFSVNYEVIGIGHYHYPRRWTLIRQEMLW